MIENNGISVVSYGPRYDQWVVILTPFLKPSKPDKTIKNRHLDRFEPYFLSEIT
jgi:hypothetical protein